MITLYALHHLRQCLLPLYVLLRLVLEVVAVVVEEEVVLRLQVVLGVGLVRAAALAVAVLAELVVEEEVVEVVLGDLRVLVVVALVMVVAVVLVVVVAVEVEASHAYLGKLGRLRQALIRNT